MFPDSNWRPRERIDYERNEERDASDEVKRDIRGGRVPIKRGRSPHRVPGPPDTPPGSSSGYPIYEEPPLKRRKYDMSEEMRNFSMQRPPLRHFDPHPQDFPPYRRNPMYAMDREMYMKPTKHGFYRDRSMRDDFSRGRPRDRDFTRHGYLYRGNFVPPMGPVHPPYPERDFRKDYYSPRRYPYREPDIDDRGRSRIRERRSRRHHDNHRRAHSRDSSRTTRSLSSESSDCSVSRSPSRSPSHGSSHGSRRSSRSRSSGSNRSATTSPENKEKEEPKSNPQPRETDSYKRDNKSSPSVVKREGSYLSSDEDSSRSERSRRGGSHHRSYRDRSRSRYRPYRSYRRHRDSRSPHFHHHRHHHHHHRSGHFRPSYHASPGRWHSDDTAGYRPQFSHSPLSGHSRSRSRSNSTDMERRSPVDLVTPVKSRRSSPPLLVSPQQGTTVSADTASQAPSSTMASSLSSSASSKLTDTTSPMPPPPPSSAGGNTPFVSTKDKQEERKEESISSACKPVVSTDSNMTEPKEVSNVTTPTEKSTNFIVTSNPSPAKEETEASKQNTPPTNEYNKILTESSKNNEISPQPQQLCENKDSDNHELDCKPAVDEHHNETTKSAHQEKSAAQGRSHTQSNEGIVVSRTEPKGISRASELPSKEELLKSIRQIDIEIAQVTAELNEAKQPMRKKVRKTKRHSQAEVASGAMNTFPQNNEVEYLAHDNNAEQLNASEGDEPMDLVQDSETDESDNYGELGDADIQCMSLPERVLFHNRQTAKKATADFTNNTPVPSPSQHNSNSNTDQQALESAVWKAISEKRLRVKRQRQNMRKQYKRLWAAWRTQQRADKTLDVVHSEEEYKRVVAHLQHEEETKRRYSKTLAEIPPLLTPEEREEERLMDRNQLIVDCFADEQQRRMREETWTDEEKQKFNEIYIKYPKDMRRIASFLPYKTTYDVINYYYNHKYDPEFKKLIQEHQLKTMYNKKIISEGASSKGPSSRTTTPSSKPCTRSPQLLELEELVPRELRSLGVTPNDYAMMNVGRGRSRHTRRPSTASSTPPSLSPKLTPQHAPQQPSLHHHHGEEEGVRWTEDEKVLFIQLLKEHGRNFEAISAGIRSKSQSQCKNYFHNNKRKLGLEQLVPQKTKDQRKRRRGPRKGNENAEGPPRRRRTSNWTAEERRTLLSLLSHHGQDWRKLAHHLPNKSQTQIRNYFTANKDSILAQLEQYPDTKASKSSRTRHNLDTRPPAVDLSQLAAVAVQDTVKGGHSLSQLGSQREEQDSTTKDIIQSQSRPLRPHENTTQPNVNSHPAKTMVKQETVSNAQSVQRNKDRPSSTFSAKQSQNASQRETSLPSTSSSGFPTIRDLMARVMTSSTMDSSASGTVSEVTPPFSYSAGTPSHTSMPTKSPAGNIPVLNAPPLTAQLHSGQPQDQPRGILPFSTGSTGTPTHHSRPRPHLSSISALLNNDTGSVPAEPTQDHPWLFSSSMFQTSSASSSSTNSHTSPSSLLSTHPSPFTFPHPSPHTTLNPTRTNAGSISLRAEERLPSSFSDCTTVSSSSQANSSLPQSSVANPKPEQSRETEQR